MSGLTIAFLILVFIVPLAAFLITVDWQEPDVRPIPKQLFAWAVVTAVLVILYSCLNLALHGGDLAKWYGGLFVLAYSGSGLVRIVLVAWLRRRAVMVQQ